MKLAESINQELFYSKHHVTKRIELKFSDGTNCGTASLEFPQNVSSTKSGFSIVMAKEIMDLASDLLAPSTHYDGMSFELIGSHDNTIIFRITFHNGHRLYGDITDEINNLSHYLVSVSDVDISKFEARF